MTEPTIPWRDGLAEFLPPAKKVQAIIRHVLGQHTEPSPVAFVRTPVVVADPDHLTDQIITALTKETP